MIGLVCGMTACVVKKFSVSNFWNDIRASQATYFIYVGETIRCRLAYRHLFRFVSLHPEQIYSILHLVHWTRSITFKRCLVMDLDQMYGRYSKKGSLYLLSASSTVQQRVCLDYKEFRMVIALQSIYYSPNSRILGSFFEKSVGHHGAILRRLMQGTIVAAAIDHESGDLLRDSSSGLVILSPLSTGGEILYRLNDAADFQGYRGDRNATQKKLARNVCQKDDLYYRSGDVLRCDDDGRWFFMDRLGDTFRWKSENVSTLEVSAAVCAYVGVIQAVVYGVSVPRHDGRAGCARIYLPEEQQAKLDYTELLR